MGLRISDLRLALPVDAEPEEIYRRFRRVMDLSPVTTTELADELGVSQTAVSRWGSGKSRPTLEQAMETLEIVEDRLAEIQRRVDEAREAVEVGRTAVQARKAYEESRDEADLKRFDEASDRAREVLSE